MKIKIGLCFISCVLFLSARKDAYADSSSDTAFINHLNALSIDLLNRDPDSCRSLAVRVIALSEKINYARGLGDGYMRLGNLSKRESKFDSAISLYRKSLYYRKLSRRQRDIGSTCNNLGFAFSRIGESDSALYYELEAIKIFEATKDSDYLILALINIGSVYQDQKNYSEAETNYLKAIAVASSQRDSSNMFLAMGNLGGMYIELKNYVDARPLLIQSIRFYSKKNDQKQLPVCLTNLGRFYEKISKPDSALIFYRKSAEMDSIRGSTRDWALTLGNIGVIYKEQQQFNKAIHFLQKSVNLSTAVGDKELSSSNYKNLSESYRGIGDYISAYNAQQQFQLYNDSVFNDNKAKAITEMQTKYETEKKEATINLLSTTNDLLSTQNKVQRLQKNIFLAGVIALFVGSLWLFIFFRQKQQLAKRNDQIQKQQIGELLNTQEIKSLNAMMDGQDKERKRIAADLHDRIGSSLSAMKLHFTGFAKSANISQTQSEFVKVNSMFDDVVKEVRQVSHDLASGVLMKFGLVSALKDLSESIESAGTMKVNFFTLGIDERLDHRTEISLYRITQELISNILKHAQAKEINIQLNRHDGDVSLMVEDNGTGFDPAKASGGIGMRNIRSRVDQLHGNVFFDSSPGNGCTVTIELPITSKS